MTPVTITAEVVPEAPLTCNTDGLCVPDWLHQPWERIQRGEHQLPEDLVGRAFEYAYRLHEGQCRRSGEPYIIHPIEVAGILRELGGSNVVIAAGFLHDVVEDTSTTCEDIEAIFGKEVRHLVEGVTKLSKFNFESKTESQAENFRKMFLAMAQDIRVIVVKLADRLHNMRTLQHLRSEKQVAISRETREIFAPLANRLGIGNMKWELEDLAFQYIEPENYKRIELLVSESRKTRESHINTVVHALRQQLDQMNVSNYEISGRPKHLYGIFRKMERQKKDFDEIYDVQAVRVILNNNDKGECYQVLAAAHDSFRAIPGRFKDYISLPKPNRYQSLHTAVFSPGGKPIEVQIRTREMHHIAEYGIAAHWKYKETNSTSQMVTGEDEKYNWLRRLMDSHHDMKDPQDFLDGVREELFDSEVYVFSPKGDVYCLPKGSTPVDFAYRIHTEVGNHCSGALVNSMIVPLHRQLKHGDMVSIITQNNARPSIDWINFVATSSAKSRIRQWFKRSRREENIVQGRGLLEKELGKSGLDSLLKSEQMQKLAERCNYHNVEDLLAALGYGQISINMVVNKLRENQQQQVRDLVKYEGKIDPAQSKSLILGIEGIRHSMAGCCKPLPGDPILGVVTMGSNRMISIHNRECHNLHQVPAERLIHVEWNRGKGAERPMTHPIDIRVESIDRVGVLKDILTKLSDNKVNVRAANVKTKAGHSATIELNIDIVDRHQYEKICQQIMKMCDTVSVCRVLHDS